MVPQSPRHPAVAPLLAWRGFIVASAARELRLRYARSLLGWVWLVLPPAVLIAIYTLVFSRLMRGAGTLPDRGPFTYSIYLCAGLLTWQWFAELLPRAVGVFTVHAAMLKKTTVPWHVLLAVDVLVTGFGMALQMLLFAVLLLSLGMWPGWAALQYLPLLACEALLALGLGIGLGVVNVFFRDVGLALPLVVQLWFWLTPVVYPVDALPEAAHAVMRWNPMLPLVTGFQNIVISSENGVPWAHVCLVTLFAVVMFSLSMGLYSRNRGLIRDEL